MTIPLTQPNDSSSAAGVPGLPEETDVAILGAGPIGLDAALAMAAAGRTFVLLECGSCAAAGVRSWGSVQLFSPWSMNLSQRMRHCLAEQGFRLPAEELCPTGEDLCRIALDPIAQSPGIASHLCLRTRAVSVGREGLLKSEEIGSPRRAQQQFRLLLETPAGEALLRARVVLDCTGGMHRAHWLGASGIPAPGERALDLLNNGQLVRTLSGFLQLAADHEGGWNKERVLLVGAGHSAQTAAVALADGDAQVVWALRGDGNSIAPIDDDPLPQRSVLQAQARALVDGDKPLFETRLHTSVEEVRFERTPKEEIGGTRRAPITVFLRQQLDRNRVSTANSVEVDRIVALVGSDGDHQLYRELQVQECYATTGPMRLASALLGAADPENAADCLAQVSHGADTLVTPEPGYFILGAKSYGRNSAFLLRVGYQQVNDLTTLI